jgi:hypothetical protein
MDLSKVRLSALHAKMPLMLIYYDGEFVTGTRHLTPEQARGFIVSGKWPQRGAFEEFFRTRRLPIPMKYDTSLVVRVLSAEEEAKVLVLDPEPARKPSKTALAKARAQAKKFLNNMQQALPIELDPVWGGFRDPTYAQWDPSPGFQVNT